MSSKVSKILIVDDEPHVTHVVRYKLEQAGFEVVVASNARQAFDLARKIVPDLVVTDFQMPGSSGLDLARQLAGLPETKAIPIIMLTARGHRAPIGELARTNVRSILAKPFSPRKLLEKVRELIGVAAAAAASASAAASAPAPVSEVAMPESEAA